MDFVKNLGGSEKKDESSSDEQKQGGGSFLSGVGDKINAAAGGGKESEKNEDMLDKGNPTQEASLMVMVLLTT